MLQQHVPRVGTGGRGIRDRSYGNVFDGRSYADRQYVIHIEADPVEQVDHGGSRGGVGSQGLQAEVRHNGSAGGCTTVSAGAIVIGKGAGTVVSIETTDTGVGS